MLITTTIKDLETRNLINFDGEYGLEVISCAAEGDHILLVTVRPSGEVISFETWNDAGVTVIARSDDAQLGQIEHAHTYFEEMRGYGC